MDFGKAEKTDRAHVEGVRNAVGPDAPIMFDVGWAYDSGGPEWDLTTALRRANIFSEYDIYWLEEPLHPDDLDGYRELCDRSPVRIAAGEEMATIHEFRDLIERGQLDVLQPDVARVGGVTETMRIAALAACAQPADRAASLQHRHPRRGLGSRQRQHPEQSLPGIAAPGKARAQHRSG